MKAYSATVTLNGKHLTIVVCADNQLEAFTKMVEHSDDDKPVEFFKFVGDVIV